MKHQSTDVTDAWRGEEGVQRLKKMHAKRTSDDQTLKAIVSKAIGKGLASYKRIISGEVNEVYEATLTNGTNIILRIGHIENKSFESETWAIEQSRRAGVPHAQVLAIGEITTDGRTLYYSLQEKLTGKRFDDLLWGERITPERAERITQNAGEALARLHSVRTKGYGYIRPGGQGQFVDMNAWVHSHLEKREIYGKLFGQHNLTAADLAATFTRLEDAKNIFAEPPHLLHGDFGPKHIFVDDSDEITGIIDLEQASSGDMVLDLAGWQFWFKESVPIDWLLAGYSRAGNVGDNFEARMNLAQLHATLGLLDYYTNVSPVPQCANDAAKVIKDLID
ncbi:MAG TPA: phosphotransferase [Candidatus Saccharimonadales bacterium]|nr:phosphotransferase [Candidatus Saccharimonadales bacterium]